MTKVRFQDGIRSRLVGLLAGVVLLLLASLGGLAAADTGSGTDAPLPTDAEVAAAIESPPPGSVQGELTNTAAAEGVPLHDLGREEALELLTGVFDQQVEAPAGIYDELQEASLVSPNVAVVPQGSLGQQPSEASGEEPASEGESSDHPPSSPAELSHSTLVESTVPLQPTSNASEPIDLSLTEAGGHLEPADPLVEAQIPTELGEGIELPGAGIGIALAGAAAEREPTVIGGSVAAYPNVAADTDLAISPTPSGVETLTQLRSPDSPTSETYNLSLPVGAQLVATDDGGAQVRSGGETLMSVQPPSAIDAAGEPVPVEMEVAGSALKLHVNPPADAQLPILLDPVFQTYEWAAKGTNKGICSSSFGTTPPGDCQHQEEWAYEVVENPWGGLPHLSTANGWGPAQPGIFVHAEGQQRSGDHAAVIYTVPRYFKETPAPTSYIKGLRVSDMTWQALGQYASPYVFMGIWDSTAPGWVSYYSHTGQTEHGVNEPSHVYEFPNSAPDTHAKVASVGIFDTEASASSNANLYVGAATVELGDGEAPSSPIPVPQSQWVNQTAPPLAFTDSDTGLGVYAMTAGTEEVGSSGQPLHTWKALNGCIGVGNSACPRTWASSESGHQSLTYEPSVLSTGVDYVSLVGEDPVGNKSASSWAQVRVDHQTPTLALSGNLTEQGTVGTKLTSYTLNYAAADGDETAPAAATPIGTTGTGTGQMERPFGVAVDKSGNVWMVDRENNCVEVYSPAGTLIRQFGSSYGAPGSGNGQLSSPSGIAISSSGNVWVADLGNKRVQEFNEKGEFIRSVTYAGGLLGTGKMAEPYAVATGPEETLWVGDVGSHRVYQFKENGTFVKALSSAGSVNLTTPAGIAVDRFGNAYVAEQSSSQILELDPSGNLVNKFGTAGTGQGQLSGPVGLAFAASGNLLVADANNNRIEEFKPSGAYMRTFASLGSEAKQLKEPRGIATGPENTLYVADAANHRIAKWNHADLDPQSGAAKVEVKVDGTAAKSEAPGCANKDCTINGSWTMNADNYPAGHHKVEVITTDGVGLATTKTLEVETHGDYAAPQVALSGTMTEEAKLGNTRPTYKLKVSATDPGSAEERKSGVASIAIKLDGTTVDSTSPGCPSEGCSLTREWTLESAGKSVGTHNVEVITTDAAGHTTTKTQAVTIERDTTAPTLETGGEKFFTAPGGWLEQKSYEYIATSTDPNGYGVTSLQLKIDGAVIKSTSGTCAAGGCTKFLWSTINMASYSGGEHSAELIATDGAGNTRTKHWTINVDPEGHISTEEAADTLEAVEGTTAETPVAPTEELLEPEQMEGGDNPGLKQVGTEITSTGVPDTTTMSTNPATGFTIESPEGETHITPAVGENASPTTITEEVAGVSANVSSEADSVIRPEYNGVQTFQEIRSEQSPEKYSWTVHLYEGQTLVLVNPSQAEVLYEGGKVAFLITAEQAHDATGKEVSTSFEVSGDVLTLHVELHKTSYVYPIVAGAGWETSYLVPVEIEGPEDEAQIREREERERAEREQPVEEAAPPPPASGAFSESEAQRVLKSGSFQEIIPAPEPSGAGGGATASRTPEKTVKRFEVCEIDHCSIWHVELWGATYNYKHVGEGAHQRWTSWWQEGTEIRSHWYWNGIYSPELEVNGWGCGFTGPGYVWSGDHEHLTAWGRYAIHTITFTPNGDTFEQTRYLALQIWVWPNGYQQRVEKEWTWSIQAEEFEKCQ